MRELLPNTETETQPEAAIANWRNKANCRDSDPDMFFPESKDRRYAEEALKVCRGCKVKEDCLDHAIENDEKYGIWGGMTPEARKKLSRRSTNTQTRHRIHKSS
ncbi:WhiB family transcriptional regulator [Candidatus Nanosynbacter lyticus]|uniref:WhiB family transcriptional regulator n=1 Tax=Candidatus Nanosynbacter lyticus TaxID=2093824 RepID=UPI00255444F8|nr:WhiB family transcriptional regulator [Candidatus Nanosynbacter lyticus]WLD46779.1 Transcriptional regulator WhiB2 [Candidatus Nanosynbacter lyticus]